MTELADYAWLTAPETALLLADLAGQDASLHVQLQRLRKAHGPERARLAVELAGLRRKAVAKFGSLAQRMFFTELGLQQSTDMWIARYKARRFPAGKFCHDYCCGIGGDLLGLLERGPAIGVDRAPEIAALAEANLKNVAGADRYEIRVGEAKDYPPSAEVAWHLDPDRRSEGRRSTQLRWHSPGPELIEDWLEAAPSAAIKLAPATRVSDRWQEDAELEWISRDRECRQLVAWFGSLAKRTGRRRATKIVHSIDGWDFEAHEFEGEAEVEAPLVTSVQQFVYDTDPAVRAAGLTGCFADEHGLAVISSGASYLTGESKIEHPLASCFRVIDELPLREKTLCSYFRDKQTGTLEIKKLNVDADPEQLRRKLKLKGEASGSLLLTRIGKREVALVAERC